MADFKDEFSPELVAALSAELRRAAPQFPSERFEERAIAGLEPLALMDRMRHIADALAACLPADFVEAAELLDRAVDSPTLTGWMALPCSHYVSVAGIEHPRSALPLLARLTPRFSSEFAIRPFIERSPAITFEFLREWSLDPNEHVRRLVSEGTRPRLPWASRLRALMADPSPAVDLLDRLVEDPSEYVRRSVANHLNDIAKDHPRLAVDIAARWLARGNDASARVVRHGLRTLVKNGDPAALALLGFDHGAAISLDRLEVTPHRVPIGGEVTIDFSLSTTDAPVDTVIDYLVHHAGARGPRGARVFKLTTSILRPGSPRRFSKRHRFAEVTVRRIHPGTHRIEIQVNGRVLGGADVEVYSPESSR